MGSAERDDDLATVEKGGQDGVIMVGIPPLWSSEGDPLQDFASEDAAREIRCRAAGATKNRPEP